MVVTDKTPVSYNDKLPDEVDVVVIGAGIIGISIAYFLGRQGKSVLVCEKGRVAGEQSCRNWGWVRQQGRDSSELPIMKESLQIWKRLASEIGEDLGFHQGGCLYLAENDNQQQENETWLTVARDHELDTQLLTASETARLLGQDQSRWKGALFTPSDGRAEPFIAVPKLARAAKKLGVSIIENCAVRALDVSAGKISGVITEQGRVRAKQVVSAAGAWSSLLAGYHNIIVPQLRVKNCVARTSRVDGFFAGNAVSDKIAFRRRQDGGYTVALADHMTHNIVPDSFRYLPKFIPLIKKSLKEISLRIDESFFTDYGRRKSWNEEKISPFERNRILDPKPDPELHRKLRQRLNDYVPALADVTFLESWAGMIETSPDVLPIISKVDSLPGLTIVAGLSGHGFGIGPGIGRVVADMVAGRPTGHDLTRFRLSRFHDGSPIIPGPSL
ncbi:NAD(P)/FAD-dependent oxidoreductase [Kiloniella laminariae]|uniref:NAD(P)/FAD-dependent oxidoreductase n=1 Tax=Kiloniella laminariae TaxID=454162 RepID=UPI000374C00D|nr:FAD-binding oxidoreductase [Kiloniella laminariae]